MNLSKEEVNELVDLLNSVSIGIDDWTRMYAPEFCNEKKVEETRKRIYDEGGTLYYMCMLEKKLEKVRSKLLNE